MSDPMTEARFEDENWPSKQPTYVVLPDSTNHYTLIKNPSDYETIEAMDVIESVLHTKEMEQWFTPHAGALYFNICKYLLRCHKKGKVKDLKKAKDYLEWLIKEVDK